MILIFSVNKSAHFTGFARMTSPISNKIAHYWKHTETIKLGGCFKIEWITYACLNFNRLQNITNPLNNNEPIRKSRDTQELPQKEGKEVCSLFEIPFKEAKEEFNPKLDESREPSEDIFSELKEEDPGKPGQEAARRQPHGRLEATKRHHDLSFERIKSKKRSARGERKKSRKRSSSSERTARNDTKLRIKSRKRSRSGSKVRKADRKYK